MSPWLGSVRYRDVTPGQTDGQTDGRTELRAIALRAYCRA